MNLANCGCKISPNPPIFFVSSNEVQGNVLAYVVQVQDFLNSRSCPALVTMAIA